jgi:hypothetical protein
MDRIVRRIVVVVCGFSLLACSLSSVMPTAVPTAVPAATAVVAVEPTAVEAQATAAGPPQELEPCSLLTAAEAEAILGEPAAPPQVINGACAYSNAKDSLYLVSVAAAQGPQTEGILQGLAFLLGIAGAPLDEAKLAELKSLSDAQDFQGFFGELVALAQGVPAVHAQLVEGVEAGFWAWLNAQGRRQGALAVARGRTMVNVNVVVADSQSEEAMLAAAKALADQVFGRLPASFVLPMATPSPVPPTIAPTEPLPTPPTAIPTHQPPTKVPTSLPPTAVPTQNPNAPPPGFVEQPSYTGDCKNRPAGSICLGFDDGYIWFLSPFNDAVTGWGEAGTWQGKKIQVASGQFADYQHIVGTNLVRKVKK